MMTTFHSNFYETLAVIETATDKTILELIQEIDELVKETWKYVNDPENLSRSILQLTIKNVGLGNQLAEVSALESEAEAQWKHSIEKGKLALVEEGMPATVAESRARVESKELGDEYRSLKRAVVMLKLKREDVDNIASKGQTRLAVIREDLRQA